MDRKDKPWEMISAKEPVEKAYPGEGRGENDVRVLAATGSKSTRISCLRGIDSLNTIISGRSFATVSRSSC
jgi:hypothetical protein